MHSSRMPALYRMGGGQRPPGQNLPSTENPTADRNHHPCTETLTPWTDSPLQRPLDRDPLERDPLDRDPLDNNPPHVDRQTPVKTLPSQTLSAGGNNNNNSKRINCVKIILSRG